MSAKAVVKAFYDLNLATDQEAIKHFHKECKIHWNSSRGYSEMDYNYVVEMLEGLRKSFLSFNYRLSHLLEDGNTVTARYTIYVTPIERPKKEDALAHFISIWEVKDGLLYRGHEISQLIDENPSNMSSFSEIKV